MTLIWSIAIYNFVALSRQTVHFTHSHSVISVYISVYLVTDQWSPLNPEGKRVYDRDFLLQFQGNYYERPKGLPYVPGITLEQVNKEMIFIYKNWFYFIL